MSQTRRVHEALFGYLEPSRGPIDVQAPSTNARHPVAPAGAVPQGQRPIPASTEGPKRSNAAIPVARESISTYGIAGLQHTLAEGDVAMAERVAFSQKRGSDMATKPLYVRVRSIDSVNYQLAMPDAHKPTGTPDVTFEEFGYAVDGIINNVDGADPRGEFRDRPICNSVVQGPCRFLKTQGPRREPGPRRIQIRDVVYVGLFKHDAVDLKGNAVPNHFMYQLHVFSGRDVKVMTAGNNMLGRLILCWRLGSVVDSNQEPEFLTVNVGVERLYALDTSSLGARVFNPSQKYDHRDDGIFIKGVKAVSDV